MNAETLKHFAESHNLSLKKDDCGDHFIPGASGHIFDGYAVGKLGVYVNGETPKAWTYARRKMEQAGMTIRQNGDVDGVAVFDPANGELARAAIKITGARVRRMAGSPSPAQIAARQRFADRQRITNKAA